MVDIVTWLQGMFGSDFWSNFWPNFFADLLVGVILTALISWLYSKTKRAKAEVSIYPLEVAENKLRLNFEVKNTGNISFATNEIYWTVYAPPHFYTQHPLIEVVPIEGGTYHQYSGATAGPIFPNSKLYILSLDIWPIPEHATFDFYCVLSTAHGYFPKKATPDKRGRAGYKALQKLSFTISPDEPAQVMNQN